LEQHTKWLLNEGGKRANLSGANLSGANLSGANLSGANLSRANIIEANLSRANLYGANLIEANLSRANLIEANLYRANLSRANFSRANLSGANLSGANIIEAKLYGANIIEANLSRAKLQTVTGEPLELVDRRPIITIGPIGADNDMLLAFNTDKGIYIRYGYFWDTLGVFEDTVQKTHGDNQHGRDCQTVIVLLRGMWASAK